jgi:ubiquitin carboxyl-terminal hydrolase L3
LAEAREAEEKEGKGAWKGDIWWIKQTVCIQSFSILPESADVQISNACGSIGLLHALLNLPDSGAYGLEADSPLKQFKAETMPLPGQS